MINRFEAVIGLEIHAQLLTKSKAFSSDSTNFGDAPNTNTSPYSLGHPGTLPLININLVKYAIKAGLATNCKIREVSTLSRKNYFYHDLPKGYQITQYESPICYDGFINFEGQNGEFRKIGITRIHIEEDSGKSIYDKDRDTLLDFNRAGVPLIEIVSEPDIRSAAEAYKFLNQIKLILIYLGICSGNMEEGALRCDANISVRLKGDTKLYSRTEVKNLNSFKNVEKAINYEVKRQIALIKLGESIIPETLLWDDNKHVTKPMRLKEGADDYRYFPDPDLPPIKIPLCWLDEINKEIPELPMERKQRLISEYLIPINNAEILIQDKDLADYFEKCCSFLTIKDNKRFKSVSNWIVNELIRYLSQNDLQITQIKIQPEHLAELVELNADGIVSTSIAKTIFPKVMQGEAPRQVILNKNLVQDFNMEILEDLIKKIVAKNPDLVVRYKSGQKNILGYFVGQVIKETKGKADPTIVSNLIVKSLTEN